MIESTEKYKPGVHHKLLLGLAGAMWLGVGIMLVVMAVHWLQSYDGNMWYFAIPGFIGALVIHHYGFLRIVDRNLGRISRLSVRSCIFSFISWRSYVIIAIMAGMGFILRHSAIPKQYLSSVYLAIGMALMLSSIRYFRHVLIHH